LARDRSRYFDHSGPEYLKSGSFHIESIRGCHAGQVHIQRDLTVADHPEIFVVGDSARRALGAYLQLRPEAQPGDPLFLGDRDRAFSPRAVAKRLSNAWRGGPRSRACA
jgi:site-specific recombinase XerC